MNKARQTAASKESKGDGEAKPKGAPRARKWDYGITDEAKISVKVEEEKIPTLKGDLTGDLTAVGKGCTVAEFKAKGGTRHGLRVLSRRGIIQLTHANGEVYPKTYVAPPKKEPKPKAAKEEKAETAKA